MHTVCTCLINDSNKQYNTPDHKSWVIRVVGSLMFSCPSEPCKPLERMQRRLLSLASHQKSFRPYRRRIWSQECLPTVWRICVIKMHRSSDMCTRTYSPVWNASSKLYFRFSGFSFDQSKACDLWHEVLNMHVCNQCVTCGKKWWMRAQKARPSDHEVVKLVIWTFWNTIKLR